MAKEIQVKVEQSFADSLLNQYMSVWITPEIQKRKDAGNLPDTFSLERAQVLFCLGMPPIIRLNEEVDIKIKIKVNKSIQKGEAVFAKDIDEVAEIKNQDDEDDFAFLILIKLSDKWCMAFNFEYDASKSKQFLKLGAEFYSSAENEYGKQRFRQMIEPLSIAAENFAKARIYLIPDRTIRKTKTHGSIKAVVNIHARDGTIKAHQKSAFNKLLELRDPARYDPSFGLTPEKAKELLDAIRSIAEEVNKLIA